MTIIHLLWILCIVSVVAIVALACLAGQHAGNANAERHRASEERRQAWEDKRRTCDDLQRRAERAEELYRLLADRFLPPPPAGLPITTHGGPKKAGDA